MPICCLLIALTALLAAAVRGQSTTQITRNAGQVEDLYPEISSDGYTLAWVRNDYGTRLTEYWIARAPLYQPQRLGPGTRDSFRLSGDGSTLYYVRGTTFYGRDTTTGVERAFSAPNVYAWFLTVSYDARYVAYPAPARSA